MKTDQKKQGFTLVELMVGMIAGSILLLIVGLLLLMPIRTMRINKEYAQVRRDIAIAVRIMTKDIRTRSFSDVDVSQSNVLLLNLNPGPPVRQKIEYKFESGALNRYINDANQGAVIEEGLTQFTSSVNAWEGVVLEFEMVSDGGNASIAHKTFIHTRN